ncbi:MAG: hypothetical protein K2G04_10820, partial [Oscillospiraceae bacterium]|nr:hypothetical protein [Oscillospiraceae bacterium]
MCQYKTIAVIVVVKYVSEAGGYGVVFGRDMTKRQFGEWKTLITEQSRRFITQEVIDFIDLPVIDEDSSEVMRKANLGRSCCRARKPRCGQAVLQDFPTVPICSWSI